MLGTFQQSHLRIEVEANEQTIRDSLLQTDKLSKWMGIANFSSSLPEKLEKGVTFTTSLGLIEIAHEVQTANNHCLRLLLSKSIDGYHEWYWGDGWIQSRLEGISLLPLNLGQTFSLMRLRQFLASQKTSAMKDS
ncbi:MAG: hypothetical protein QNJ41_08570 [Xenococcaceae cyanobacterium MO_188.B32]|nr:hypothetical protein [Xenococcaceae cyanobacterium MO_188.B32]